MASDGQMVYIIDENELAGQMVARTLRISLGTTTRCFTRRTELLKTIMEQNCVCCDLLIANGDTSGMAGIDLVRQIKNLYPTLPVIYLLSEPDVDHALKAVRSGVAAVGTKPIKRQRLLAMSRKALADARSFQVSDCQRLSTAEREILRFIVNGYSTKEIAHHRSRSIRTIEIQRYSIMQKLKVENVVDLVKRVSSLRIPMRISSLDGEDSDHELIV